MTTKISLQQLAEKLGGKYWEKGELKRMYLDEGYNTKKMSTKTFVWQNENGEFMVSCKVDCPSQPAQWEISQENQIKESVNEKIANIIAQSQLTLVDFKITEEHKPELLVYVKFANQEPVWYTESNFQEKYGCCPEEIFTGLPVIQYTEPIISNPETTDLKTEKPVENTATPVYGVGCQVKHGKFGIGTVQAESDELLVVNFESIGEKKLLKLYVKLEVISHAN